MPVNSWTFEGLDGIWGGFINDSGLFTGFANVSTPGASSGLRRFKAAQTLPSALAAPQRKTIPGDNGPYDTFIVRASELPSGDIEMGTIDLALDAAAQGSTVWTLGQWAIGIYGMSMPTFENMLLLGHREAHSDDVGGRISGYMNELYPSVQLLPRGGDNAAYQAEGKARYSAAFLPFSVFPLGQLLDNTNFTVEDGIRAVWFSKYRTYLYATVFDGSSADMVVDHTPISVAATKVGLTTSAGVFSLATVSSVTPSTKTITLSASPASGTIGVAMFEGKPV